MKRLITLFILVVLAITTSSAKSRCKDLSGEIAIKGKINKEYNQAPVGTPVVIRRVMEIKKGANYESNIYYAVEINGIQFTVPLEEMGAFTITPPESDSEFWQQVYLKKHLYEHFNDWGYKKKLRQNINEECIDYQNKLQDIAYQDDYLTSYVQGVFAKLNSITIDRNRSENLNVSLIQSPDPDAFMLPNGSMIISTGLLCTLDSEDELAAIIANELAHFALDHQVYNIYVTERRAKRAIFWAEVFSGVTDASLDEAYYNNNKKAYTVSLIASAGLIASLISIPTIDRLGMSYKIAQEIEADRLANELLVYKGYNPSGLASALGKIVGYYDLYQRSENLTRYNSIKDLQKRIEKAGEADSLVSPPYLKNTCHVVTFNASMNYADKRYKEAVRLIQKNMENNFVTDDDYIILIKSLMALSNTEQTNNQCLEMLDKAQEFAGESPNLDIYKQRILLLMRMNKQAKAAGILKEYLVLLNQYQSQAAGEAEKEWTNKEIGWASQMLDKISRI